MVFFRDHECAFRVRSSGYGGVRVLGESTILLAEAESAVVAIGEFFNAASAILEALISL